MKFRKATKILHSLLGDNSEKIWLFEDCERYSQGKPVKMKDNSDLFVCSGKPSGLLWQWCHYWTLPHSSSATWRTISLEAAKEKFSQVNDLYRKFLGLNCTKTFQHRKTCNIFQIVYSWKTHMEWYKSRIHTKERVTFELTSWFPCRRPVLVQTYL